MYQDSAGIWQEVSQSEFMLPGQQHWQKDHLSNTSCSNHLFIQQTFEDVTSEPGSLGACWGGAKACQPADTKEAFWKNTVQGGKHWPGVPLRRASWSNKPRLGCGGLKTQKYLTGGFKSFQQFSKLLEEIKMNRWHYSEWSTEIIFNFHPLI